MGLAGRDAKATCCDSCLDGNNSNGRACSISKLPSNACAFTVSSPCGFSSLSRFPSDIAISKHRIVISNGIRGNSMSNNGLAKAIICGCLNGSSTVPSTAIALGQGNSATTSTATTAGTGNRFATSKLGGNFCRVAIDLPDTLNNKACGCHYFISNGGAYALSMSIPRVRVGNIVAPCVAGNATRGGSNALCSLAIAFIHRGSGNAGRCDDATAALGAGNIRTACSIGIIPKCCRVRLSSLYCTSYIIDGLGCGAKVGGGLSLAISSSGDGRRKFIRGDGTDNR